jgi:hypothetical protein
MAMVAMAAIGMVVNTMQQKAAAEDAREVQRVQQLYANRASEQRKTELDYQAAQARNREEAHRHDAAQAIKASGRDKADAAIRTRLAISRANVAVASNNLLMEDHGFYGDAAGTSALLIADIGVAGQRQIDDIGYAADLKERRHLLAAAEEDANVQQLTYSSMADIPDMVAPGPNVSRVVGASLMQGATATTKAAYKSGFLTKDTFATSWGSGSALTQS